jgi:hypothetical protein
VAFAESPPDSRDSFGMSRSRLIAKEVADLTLRDVPKGRWFDEIERSLVSANFDLRAFYRNPGSKSYYDLPFGIRQE